MVWLMGIAQHSGLGFQHNVGRRMRCAALLRLTPQATIMQSVIVACFFCYFCI